MGLQFSWIEANLLGFFVVDVLNSRGKFDEIKEKFVINPAPIASQSSLNAGGTRWTRDLPRNSLNFFTSRSKVKEQRRSTWLFKEEIDPKIVANWSDRGRRLRASRERFLGRGIVASILQTNRLDLTSIWSQRDPDFCRNFRHDRATIGPRSGVNRDARASSIACRSMGDESAPIPRQNLLDRGSIAPRSRLDRAEIVFFHYVPPPSD